MTIVEPEKFNFHFHASGSPDKPPAIFLHGFMGNCKDWKKVIRFVSRDYYCLTIDLPGHGKTALKEYISFEKTAAALIEFLRQQEIRRCFLVGYSMGGRIALFLALRFPDYFSKVVLESASPGLPTQEERESRLKEDETIARQLESGDFKFFLLKWYSRPLFKGLGNQLDFHQLLKARLANNPKSLARSLRIFGTGNQPSLWEELHQCKIPILVLAGEEDKKYQLIAEEMSQSSQLIQAKIVEKCSHNIHFQQPKRLANYLCEFLDGN